MLSYRHEFHAGNVGDLIKHAILSSIITYLQQKPAPIRYIDTHAGPGLYATTSAMAEKTGEYKCGVGSIPLEEFPEQLHAYRDVLAEFVTEQLYPGSPLLAAKLLRAQDELRLFELHSSEYPRLQELFKRDRRVQVGNSDGFASVKALLPVKNSRALVLIDPSYEVKTDYEAVVACLKNGYARMPNAVFAVWYPVIGNPALEVMIKNIAALVKEKFWRFELSASDPDTASGMTATGMLVINPPWTLAADMEAAFQSMCKHLPFELTAFTAECLKP